MLDAYYAGQLLFLMNVISGFVLVRENWKKLENLIGRWKSWKIL